MGMNYGMMSENEILNDLMDMGEWAMPEFTADSEDDSWENADW